MATTIGGVVVIAAAAWIAVARGDVDIRNGILFGTGIMLVLNGMLGFQRVAREGETRPPEEKPAKVAKAPLLDHELFAPRGMTPLLDATTLFLDRAEARVAQRVEAKRQAAMKKKH